MKLLYFMAMALFIVGGVRSEIISVNSGCRRYANDKKTCLACSANFIKDEKGICQPISPLCLIYDNVKGVCLTCSKGYYKKNKACSPIDALCKIFNEKTQLCTQCYLGYALKANECVVTIIQITKEGCSLFNGSLCLKCSADYLIDAGNNCVKINPLCKSVNMTNRECSNCYSGYKIAKGTCQIDNSVQIRFPNCQIYQNQICLTCSNGYYFNTEKICQQIDPFCKTFDLIMSQCQVCYFGFVLKEGTCVVGQEEVENCGDFDEDRNCITCSSGYYLSQDFCKEIDPFCKVFDQKSLTCTECFLGFKYLDNACVQSQQIIKKDNQTCIQLKDGKCVKCGPNSYFKLVSTQSICQKVVNFCKSLNYFSGKCQRCFDSYRLNDKMECLFDKQKKNCSLFDNQTNSCSKCLDSSYLMLKKCVNCGKQTVSYVCLGVEQERQACDLMEKNPYCKANDTSILCWNYLGFPLVQRTKCNGTLRP